MTLSDPKPGGWTDEEVLEHEHMNNIRTELLKAIDGAGGGTYTLSTDLEFAGSGEVQISNVLRVLTGADLFVDSGAVLQVDGSGWEFNAAGAFNAQVDLSGNVDFFADVDVRAGATMRFFDLSALTVEDDTYTYRVPLIGASAFSTGDAAPYWAPVNEGWLNIIESSFSLIYFALPVMAGDDVVSIQLNVTGGFGSGHGGVDPSTKIRLRFLEASAADGARAALASVEDPATGATYDGSHGFQLNATTDPGVFPYTALDRQYLVEVRGENGGTGAPNENLIMAVYATIVRRQLKSINVFGSN